MSYVVVLRQAIEKNRNRMAAAALLLYDRNLADLISSHFALPPTMQVVCHAIFTHSIRHSFQCLETCHFRFHPSGRHTKIPWIYIFVSAILNIAELYASAIHRVITNPYDAISLRTLWKYTKRYDRRLTERWNFLGNYVTYQNNHIGHVI